MDLGSNGYNSERWPPKDHSTKVWSQLAKQFQRRRFFKIFLPNFLFLAMAAILVGGRGRRIQFWKGTTQGPSLPSLIQIGPVVSEELIKMWKANDDGRRTTTTTDDGRPVVAIAHPAIAGELKICCKRKLIHAFTLLKCLTINMGVRQGDNLSLLP